MKMRKVAIVGSSESHWTPERKVKAIQKIKEILIKETPQKHDPTGYDGTYSDWAEIMLISGGSPKGGIDIWAEIIADSLGVNKKIYKPEISQWYDFNQEMAGGEGWGRPEIHKKGYMSRNMEIAKNCDVLYCIDPKHRQGGGGFWTFGYAKSIGKEVHYVVIE